MKKICSNCFADKDIIGFINAQSPSIGKCDFCNLSNVQIVDIEFFYDFFQELLENFKSKSNGKMLWEIIHVIGIYSILLNYPS